MKKYKYILPLILFCALMMVNCKKKETTVEYKVIFVKKYDSLPCTVNIEYRLGTHKTSDTKTMEIGENWSTSAMVSNKEKVTLKATANTNIKSLIIRLTTDYSQESQCNTNGCTVYLEDALYED